MFDIACLCPFMDVDGVDRFTPAMLSDLSLLLLGVECGVTVTWDVVLGLLSEEGVRQAEVDGERKRMIVSRLITWCLGDTTGLSRSIRIMFLEACGVTGV